MTAFHSVYGLHLRSNAPIAGLLPLDSLPRTDLTIHMGVAPPQLGELTTFHSGDAVALFRTTAEPHAYVFEYSDGSRFTIAGDEIWSTWRSDSTPEDAATYLLGPVLAFVLRLRGVLSFHASSVVDEEGSALVISAAGGQGKSTMAAALASRGWPVLSDDVVAIEWRDGKPFALPGYPRIRLWSDSGASLFGSPEALPLLTPTWEKRYVDLTRRNFRFGDEPRPIGAIFTLAERGPMVSARELRGSEAAVALLRNTSMNAALDPPMRAAEFAQIAEVLAAVPVFALTPPDGLDRLDELCAFVQSKLVPTPELLDRAAELFDDESLDAQRLVEPSLRLLERYPPFARLLEDDEVDPADPALALPLLHQLMRQTIVTDIRFERLFVRLRRRIERAPPELRGSLAVQAYHTEYVWDDHPLQAPELEPLLAAEREEERILAELPHSGAVLDDVTARVRQQYEEAPYPRFVTVPKPPRRTLREHFHARVRGFDPATPLPEGSDILVAGGGAGTEAIGAARYYEGARVTAFDISARSLARAIRLARDHGVGNIRFVHASIEEAARWPERFDVVESYGVLHHTRDLESSWRSLIGLLKPDGVMGVGLYNAEARAWLKPIRERFAKDVEPAPENLRRVRREILAAGYHEITDVLDFYTLSGFRDLLFHAHEVELTLAETHAMIERLGLQLIGFEQEEGSIRHFWVRRVLT